MKLEPLIGPKVKIEAIGELDDYDRIKIRGKIKRASMINKFDRLLSFPHELFSEQIQLFLLQQDEKNPGSYKKLFGQIAEFLYQNFSGCFWDRSVWLSRERLLLNSVKKVVNNFIMCKLETNVGEKSSLYKHTRCKRLQGPNDVQLMLWYRLAKWYIKSDPVRAVKLFNNLHERIVDNNGNKNNLSKYLENSVDHAAVMHSLAIAYCQAHCKNSNNSSSSNFDLDKAKVFAKSAYKILENELGKGNTKTLNAYLTLAHIRINLKRDISFTEESQNYMVKFLGSEPTIGAAIELTGLPPESEEFENLVNELSWPEESANGRSYLPIYTHLEEKVKI